MGGRAFQVSTPASVSLRGVEVCDAATVVLGQQLSLPFTCNAQGMISLQYGAGDAQALLTGFISTLRQMGLTVTVTDAVSITGGSERRGASGSGQSPAGIPSQQNAGSWSALDLGEPVEQAVLDAIAIYPDTIVQSLPPGVFVEEAEATMAALNLQVELAVMGGRTYAAGRLDEVGLLGAVLSGQEFTSAFVHTSFPPTSILASMSEQYPGLTTEYQQELGRVVIAGPTEAVVQASRIVRSVASPVRPVKVDVTFLSYETTNLTDQDLDAAFNVDLGSGSLRGGGVINEETFRVTVADLVRRDAASVESRPSVTVLSGSNARFVSGQSVPILTEIAEEGGQQIDYRDAGVILDVTPTVHPSGFVSLRISASVSTVTADTTTPTFDTREVSTTLMLAPGDVVGLSGLRQSSELGERSRTFQILPGRVNSEANGRLAFFVSVN